MHERDVRILIVRHCVTCLLLAVGTWKTALAQSAPQRREVPNAEAQARAKAEIREIFKSQYDGATTTEQKLALTDAMLRQGDETDNDPAGRFVLFTIAKDVATSAGDLASTFRAIESLAKHFEVDELMLKTDSCLEAGRAVATPDQRILLADACFELLDRLMTRERYDLAGTIATTAVAASTEAGSAELMAESARYGAKVKEVKSAFDTSRTAFAALETKPAEPAANLAAGKYLCYFKGDWEFGVPMLALGSDPDLQRLAQRELELPPQHSESEGLGHGWWEVAERLAGLEKQSVQRRAAFWYRRALPMLSGLTRVKVTKRLSELQKPYLPDGCVLSLTFEDETITRLDDRIQVRDANGADRKAEMFGVTLELGPIGTAARFAGTAYASVPGAYPVARLPRTIVVWAKSAEEEFDHGVPLFGYGKPADHATFGLCALQGRWWFLGWNDGNLDSTIRLDTQWHHHAVTYDGVELRYYFDGKLSAQERRDLQTAPSPLTLGGRVDPKEDDNFAGWLDEIAVFKRVLGPREIRKVYEQGALGASLGN